MGAKESTSWHIPVNAGRPQLLTGYCPEAVAPLYVGLSTGLLITYSCFLWREISKKENKEERRERILQLEATVFYNLFLEVAYDHFCLCY